MPFQARRSARRGVAGPGRSRRWRRGATQVTDAERVSCGSYFRGRIVTGQPCAPRAQICLAKPLVKVRPIGVDPGLGSLVAARLPVHLVAVVARPDRFCGRGKARAASLPTTGPELTGKRARGEARDEVAASDLRAGDIVLMETGALGPAEGEVVEGATSVIREAGHDRSAATTETQVISDWIRVNVTAEPGEGFLDRMIAPVEGASRAEIPNEIALTVLLAGLPPICRMAVGILPAFVAHAGSQIAVPVLVTLIPTTIPALLPAIGFAGMDRLIRFNALSKSGRAVEAVGGIGTLRLDRTGTITLGDRPASEFQPLPVVREAELVAAARLSPLGDDTPEGRSTTPWPATAR